MTFGARANKDGIVKAEARCTVCSWKPEARYPSEVRSKAAQHTRETGHSTYVETRTGVTYTAVEES